MIQDILTFLTLLAAAGFALYRITHTIKQVLRGENPGCGACPLHRKMIE